MCTKFQPCIPHRSWEKSDKVWKMDKKKNDEIRRINKQQQPDSGIHDTSTHFYKCIPSFNFVGLKFLRKVWQKCLMIENWRKKNAEIKGQISSSSQILVYTIIHPLLKCVPSVNFVLRTTIHPAIVHVCTKFQLCPEKHNTSSHSPCVYQVSTLSWETQYIQP